MSASAISAVASACLARSCQFIARSVSLCRASPSGSLTGSFCKDTSSERIVSSLGRRDRWQIGQRNLTSLMFWTPLEVETLPPPAPLANFVLEALGSGTHVVWNQSLHSSHWSIKPLTGFRHTQYLPCSIPSSSNCCLRRFLSRSVQIASISSTSEFLYVATCKEWKLPI